MHRGPQRWFGLLASIWYYSSRWVINTPDRCNSVLEICFVGVCSAVWRHRPPKHVITETTRFRATHTTHNVSYISVPPLIKYEKFVDRRILKHSTNKPQSLFVHGCLSINSFRMWGFWNNLNHNQSAVNVSLVTATISRHRYEHRKLCCGSVERKENTQPIISQSGFEKQRF